MRSYASRRRRWGVSHSLSGKRRRGSTDAAAAPSDASQSSVARDQLRTKKGARLRQATKPASAASPPAFDESEGGPAPTARQKKREVLGKVLSSESSVLCRTFCRIGEPTANRLRTVFTKCETGRRSHTGRRLVEEELRAVLGGRRRRDVDDGGRVCGGGGRSRRRRGDGVLASSRRRRRKAQKGHRKKREIS